MKFGENLIINSKELKFKSLIYLDLIMRLRIKVDIFFIKHLRTTINQFTIIHINILTI